MIYRPHPKSRRPAYLKEVRKCKRIGIQVDTNKKMDWTKWQAIATINSSIGIESITKGVPVISFGNSIFSIPNISACVNPHTDDIKAILNGEYLNMIRPGCHGNYIEWVLSNQHPKSRIEKTLADIINTLD